MIELTLKEKVNALFDEDFRQKLYELVEDESDLGDVIYYLKEELDEWEEVMEEELSNK